MCKIANEKTNLINLLSIFLDVDNIFDRYKVQEENKKISFLRQFSIRNDWKENFFYWEKTYFDTFRKELREYSLLVTLSAFCYLPF